MDLYAIHKSFLDMQSDFGRSSDGASDVQQSRNREEMARLSKLINMAIFKGIVPSNRPTTYDINYDTSDSEEDTMATMHQFLPNLNNQQQHQRPSSTEFNPSLLLPFGIRGASNQNNLNAANHSGSSRVTLADQFTWGAVVCAGVFVVVFICVMAAWWVHKKQQARVNRRTAQREARRQMAEGAPYCIENDLHGPGNVPVGDIQRPPSYFEVIGFFDPPPSYNDISGGECSSQQQSEPNQQAYDNVVVVTMDELPPPFVEGDYIKTGEKIVAEDSITETSAISSLPPNTAVTVIPGREGHQEGSDS
ncbi:hypothetical protein GHT06_015946 [Daphnia sinensis]|uniref:Uncharacterized protein n=1 Tax=Daphnia sinensis TaxID=1820382 RepID=A0AAD5PTV2_9CRUS|nr:hypothetical protein GHT06_015946 [Daphnia sinensis]